MNSQSQGSALHDFHPAWWLPGGHLQSLWRKFGPGVTARQRRQRLLLDDGDFIDLAWSLPNGREPAPGEPVVLILHGLCGCSESHYVQALQHHLLGRGIASAVMNFRGCSGEPNRKARSYHSGVSGDVDQVFRRLRAQFPENPFHCAGYSLGGNVLLKWLAETGGPDGLERAVTISVPFSLAHCSAALGQGLTRWYGNYFLGRLRADLQEKERHFQQTGNQRELAELMQLGPLHGIRSLWEFDDRVTAPLHGFADAADYYEKCSSLPLLPDIGTETLLIQSTDDPLVPRESLPDPARLPAKVHLQLTRAGGHVGFFGARGSRLEQAIADFMVC